MHIKYLFCFIQISYWFLTNTEAYYIPWSLVRDDVMYLPSIYHHVRVSRSNGEDDIIFVSIIIILLSLCRMDRKFFGLQYIMCA